MRRLILILFVTGFLPADPVLAQSRDEADYTGRIEPVLHTYCGKCHGDGADEGGFDLDAYPDHAARLGDSTSWDQAAQLLASQVMPPVDQPQPTPLERQTLLDWIDSAVFYVDPENPDPGPAVVRRLSRAEYDNTIRDLFHVDTRPARAFPPDDSAHGYDRIGAAVSPLFLEKHLRAARDTAAEVTRLISVQQAGDLIRGRQFSFYAGKPEIFDEMALLRGPDDEAGFEVNLPVTALYRIQLRASSTRAGDHLAKFEILDNGRPVTTFSPSHVYSGKRQYWDASLALIEFTSGRHRFSVRSPGRAEGQIAAIHTLAVQGPYAPTPPMPGPFLRSLISREAALDLPTLRLSGEDFEMGQGKSSLDTGAAWFSTSGFRRTGIALTESGRYRFRVKAGAQQSGDETVRFELRLGERGLGAQNVTALAQREQWIEFEAEAAKGEHDLQVWFLNELIGDDQKPRRLFWLHELEIQGPLEGSRPVLTREEIPNLLAKFGRRIFRRPLSETERSRLNELVARTEGEPLEALRAGLESLISSPKFLFLGTDTRPDGDPARGSVAVDEFTLASRLSYFLWSSAPDDALLDLAEQGRLRAHLVGQVKRMLDDPRARALTEHFAGQWLQLRNLENWAPDPAQFPEFAAGLGADFRRETEMLFEHLIRENRPIHELLSADYTFANARLAAHYEIDRADTSNDAFARVSLTSTLRRGILAHAGILALTSHPTRTSPVNRGKFILEKILGTPPPPAPGNVPPLEETSVATSASLRDQLEAHRANKQCAACHAFLDPMGLALENFDAVGRWRDRENGRPIDASGRLVTGESFAGFADLQKLLAGPKRDLFVKNAAAQLLAFALGRGLSHTDKTALHEILHKSASDDHRMQSLILAVCESTPFQRMRLEN